MDASGDGIIGFMAGAAFRIGAEATGEFDEKFAPDASYGELLKHSLYFYSKDTGKPVKYIPPSYASTDIDKLPRFKTFNLKEFGCRLWWVEHGGRMDTIHDTENIKWDLWKVIYGIWNHIKNSGEYPDAENLTLEWVGTIPGKRESRRFEGDYMLSQKDIVEQREHNDAVSHGGWAMDLHPADGVFGENSGCTQWHSKGIYQIPYRTMYSRNIQNLFLAGRIISATHVAFGSSRVMATCAQNAQAVAMAATLCKKHSLLPADLNQRDLMDKLQQKLIKVGQYIPKVAFKHAGNLLKDAKVYASSEYVLQSLPFDGPWISLKFPVAQLVPLSEGTLPHVQFNFRAAIATTVQVELRVSEKFGNFTPDVTIQKEVIGITPGENFYTIPLNFISDQPQYIFMCIMEHDKVEVQCSDTRVTGLLTVFQKHNKAVSNFGKQEPPVNIGIDAFEFWTPERRPLGHNLAFNFVQTLHTYSKDAITSGFIAL